MRSPAWAGYCRKILTSDLSVSESNVGIELLKSLSFSLCQEDRQKDRG